MFSKKKKNGGWLYNGGFSPLRGSEDLRSRNVDIDCEQLHEKNKKQNSSGSKLWVKGRFNFVLFCFAFS